MNRIIIPANFNVHIEIKYDTATGQSELVFKEGSAPINQLVLAGLLTSHADGILRTLIQSAKPAKENSNA